MVKKNFGLITEKDFDNWFINDKPVNAWEGLWVQMYNLDEDAIKAKAGENIPCRTLMACLHEAKMMDNGICRFERFNDGPREEEQFFVYGFMAIRAMPECLE